MRLRRCWRKPRCLIIEHRSVPIYLNGKFRTQRITGVQRVATELVHALDVLQPAGHWVLLCPAGTPRLPLTHIEQRCVGPSGLPPYLWEQTVLPWAARGGWLVSLAGGAPALARRDFAVLHDAAVFDHPEAYAWSFVTWYRWLFRHLADRGTRLLTVSSFSRRRLALRLGLAEDRLAVLPLGADHLGAVPPDLTVLDRLSLRRRPFILAVGSANPTKNLDFLARACVDLGPGAPVLVVVGGRHDRIFATGALPLGVVHAGPVADAELVALYRHALCLIFPSVYEGFGLPPLEAMACGCPVAAARAAAVPEACGDAALYFNPTDQEDLQRAISRLLTDGPLRDELRRAGRTQAAKWNWTAAAEQLRLHLHMAGAPC
ncbi:MAG: glycosyltransferase family 4 protein [Rubrivivax sp.]|nr:glycosyltransferase family 4 protein [Rubrivivax sp.]